MTEINNSLLTEQIKNLQEDIKDLKEEYQEDIRDLKKEHKEAFKAFKKEHEMMRDRLDMTEKTTERIDQHMSFVKETMSDIKKMFNVFTDNLSDKFDKQDEKIDKRNQKIDEQIDKQNQKMDEFINSDKRRDGKKNLVVSVAQVVMMALTSLITLWFSGKYR